MSEKRVNIKITASTNEFNNAIKKAQKQVEELSESIDNLGSSKFGNKLEEQLEDLTKALKKTEEQINNIQESLDKLGKAKLGKVEDGLEDVAKAGDKLNDKLEDTTESIEDINKAKFNKIEQQFKDIVDSGEDLNKKIADVIDSLDKADRTDFNGLEKEFDTIRDAADDLSKKMRDATDTIEKNFRDATDEIDKFSQELTDVDIYADEATESISKFNRETNDLDTKELEDYKDSLQDIEKVGDDIEDTLKKAFGSLDGKSGKLDFDFSGKDKNGFVSDMAGELLAGAMVANRLENSMEGVADSIKDAAKSMDQFQEELKGKSISELGEENARLTNELEKLTEQQQKYTNELEEVTKAHDEAKKAVEEYAKEEQELIDTYNKANDAYKEALAAIDKVTKEIQDSKAAEEEIQNTIDKTTKEIDEQSKAYDDITNRYQEVRKELDKVKKSYIDLINVAKKAGVEVVEDFNGDGKGFFTMGPATEEATRYIEKISEMHKVFETLKDEYQELGKASDDAFNKLMEGMDKAGYEVTELEGKLANQKNTTESLQKIYDTLSDSLGHFKNEVDKAKKAYEDFEDNSGAYVWAQISENLEKMNKAAAENKIKELSGNMNELEAALAAVNKQAQSYADDFDNQYKAYEKLSQKVKAYLENEENGILQRERVAKSFRDVANAMEGVYKDSSKLNNVDLIDKTLSEAAEHIKDLNLVSTENLQADLKRLGEIVEDKVEKIKRFKEINKDFGSEASGQAYGLEQQAKAIRDWANSADFAIEAADTLTNAWGDLNAAGEDHMKIRERSKYIEDFGKALEKNVAQIKNNYKELETLDEIYEKCTGKERGVIDDYKQWEKNRDALLKYNKEITDYLRTVRDSGGQIDTKFLDELGNFSPQKFIDNFEKLGATSLQLQKQFNACRIELLEWLKTEKEARQEAVKHAEEALKQAKADQKAAESQEELAEATERVTKAQEELIEAKKKLEKFDEDASREIKNLNAKAEALRDIGMAAKDIEKADVAKFDKSLASLLDRLKTFDNDIPKTFAALKEDIKAVFMDLDSFDFGSVFEGLKDIGGGILGALPAELKAAAAAALALGAALKKCAEIGINQFTRGMDTVSGALSGIIGIGRDIGQEIGDAFSNITGMELDFSSLMEIPVAFEAQMQRVKAIGEMTEEDFKRMEDLAVKLGATTRYGATEVGEAMEYMGQAGWNADQIEDGVEAVLNLATVADMDLGKAAETVTDVINAFKNAGPNKLTAGNAGMVADMLNVAAVKTSTSIEQLKSAFTNVAPIAGSFKMDLKDLTAALALMGDQGVKGAKAGTAMKNLISNLNKPTEERLAWIKKYNLEGARASIVNGDLLGGIKQMKKALDGLDTPTKNAVIEAIAGKEALSGVSALLNSTEEDINELEKAMDNSTGSAKAMADEFDKSLKGALDNLAGSLETTMIQIGQKVEPAVAGVVNEITKFFNILNGFEQSSSGLTGIAGAMEHLEETTRGWGDAIANGLTTAIGAIDDFVNSESFDNLLQAGTNIINGIADGIREAADNGTLGSAISTAIGKISTWFADNLDTVIEVGKEIIDAISNGISENSDEISRAIKAVMEMQTEIDKAVAKEKWKLIGSNLVSFISEGIVSKVSVFVSAVEGFFSGSLDLIGDCIEDLFLNKLSPMIFDPITTLGETIGNFLQETIIGAIERGFDVDLSFLDGFNILNPTTWFGGKKDNKKKSSKKTTSKGSSKGGSKGNGSSPADTINKELSAVKPKTDATAASIGQGISDNITSKLETMDAAGLQALNAEMKRLQTTVTALGQGMSASFKVIQDSARTSFMGLTNIVRNQLVNVTNIMRNQMVNSANIVRNQCLNMANIFRNQFINMANITRNQMLNIANIIRNQASNARNALTSSFISMAKVVATQMNKCLSSVRNTMTQMASATSRGVTMNVSGGMPAAAPASALYAANAASTYSIGGRTSALANGASSAMSTGTASGGGRGANDGIVLEIPVMLDGKQVARATAKYVDNELKMMTKRENRKRGAK